MVLEQTMILYMVGWASGEYHFDDDSDIQEGYGIGYLDGFGYGYVSIYHLPPNANMDNMDFVAAFGGDKLVYLPSDINHCPVWFRDIWKAAKSEKCNGVWFSRYENVSLGPWKSYSAEWSEKENI